MAERVFDAQDTRWSRRKNGHWYLFGDRNDNVTDAWVRGLLQIADGHASSYIDHDGREWSLDSKLNKWTVVANPGSPHAYIWTPEWVDTFFLRRCLAAIQRMPLEL